MYWYAICPKPEAAMKFSATFTFQSQNCGPFGSGGMTTLSDSFALFIRRRMSSASTISPQLAYGPIGCGGGGGGGSQSQQNTGSVSPGLAYLGRGSESELMTSAAEQAVDVLVVFSVNVKETKSGVVKNMTKVSVYDVATEKKLGTTRRALDNVEIQNKGKKKLDDAIKQLLSTIDMKYKLSSKLAALPPGIKPEHIKGRMRKMLNGDDTEGSRLWVLA